MGNPTSPSLDSTKGKHKPTASWAEFLESYPPGVQALISDLVEVGRAGPTAPAEYHLALPDLQLHCDHSSCDGVRFFECGISRPWISEEAKSSFIVYKCRNCEQTEKLFALLFRRKGQGPTGEAVKIGEWPPFGPPVPARVITLIGPDRDLFLQGRRAEIQGMGIGAFAYYRRVVENQKAHIIDEIIRVVGRIKAPDSMAETLEAAKEETQFTTAMEMVKDALPQTLLIDGQHNPLTLLHKALSQGVHELSDKECLSRARSIRVILTDLAERLGEALKKKAELDSALTELFKS